MSLAGTRLATYEIGCPIGMGEVYRARDTKGGACSPLPSSQARLEPGLPELLFEVYTMAGEATLTTMFLRRA